MFDIFNDKYSLKAIDICPLLKKFSINIVNDFDTEHAKEVSLDVNDTFSYYLNKSSDDASKTYAEIIVNYDLCSRLGLTTSEIMAAVAHEIGHIILFFRIDKNINEGQAEEVYGDMYACRMGLARPLYTLLQKLIDSGLYPDIQNQVLKNRIHFIKPYITP